MRYMNFNLEGMIYSIPAILIAFTVREYVRAKTADKLGDKTARFQGRLTLNPLAHIDPIGFFMIVLVGLGWSKPVEVNKYAFKNPAKDNFKVNLAAWLSNLFIAIIGGLVFGVFLKLYYQGGSDVIYIFMIMFKYVMVINVNLFIFNLLPLPGLDGFRMLEYISPKNFYKISDVIYQYYSIILILVIFVGGKIISYPSMMIVNIIMKLVKTIIL